MVTEKLPVKNQVTSKNILNKRHTFKLNMNINNSQPHCSHEVKKLSSILLNRRITRSPPTRNLSS